MKSQGYLYLGILGSTYEWLSVLMILENRNIFFMTLQYVETNEAHIIIFSLTTVYYSSTRPIIRIRLSPVWPCFTPRGISYDMTFSASFTVILVQHQLL